MYNDRFTYDEFLISLIHNDIHLNLRQTADLCHTEYSLAWCHWSNLAHTSESVSSELAPVLCGDGVHLLLGCGMLYILLN